MSPSNAGVDLRGVRKVYPGRELSLRGTKLELKGPALWLRGALRAARLTSQQAPSVTALAAVDLSVRPGEVLALIGQNGSGKTTLMKILAGLLSPTSGSGEVCSVPLDRPEAIRRRVAYLATNAWMALEWPLTVEENVRYYGVLMGLSGREARARAVQALQAVDLLQDRGKYPSELSNGMRQRAALARTLLLRAPLVLLDEPGVGLDRENARRLMELVRALGEHGQTVVITGHLSADLERVADRAVVLSAGRVVADGTPDELRGRLGGQVALELVVEEGREPRSPLPDGMRRVLRTERPGPVPSVRHRLLLERSGDAAARALDWLTEGGEGPGQVTFAAESEPTLEDAVREILREGEGDGRAHA